MDCTESGHMTQHRLPGGLTIVFAGERFLVLLEYPIARKRGTIRRWLDSYWLKLVTLMADAPALIAAGSVVNVAKAPDVSVMTLTHVGIVTPDIEHEIASLWYAQHEARKAAH